MLIQCGKLTGMDADTKINVLKIYEKRFVTHNHPIDEPEFTLSRRRNYDKGI